MTEPKAVPPQEPTHPERTQETELERAKRFAELLAKAAAAADPGARIEVLSIEEARERRAAMKPWEKSIEIEAMDVPETDEEAQKLIAQAVASIEAAKNTPDKEVFELNEAVIEQMALAFTDNYMNAARDANAKTSAPTDKPEAFQMATLAALAIGHANEEIRRLTEALSAYFVAVERKIVEINNRAFSLTGLGWKDDPLGTEALRKFGRDAATGMFVLLHHMEARRNAAREMARNSAEKMGRKLAELDPEGRRSRAEFISAMVCPECHSSAPPVVNEKLN